MNLTEIEKGIYHLSLNDKKLESIIKICGRCSLSPKRNYFRALLKAIVGQQLSIYAAEVINRRFMNYFNSNPLPENILNTPDTELRKLGLSNAKTKYVKDLSLHILEKKVIFRGLSKKDDLKIIEELTAVKGIGIWTVHMFLIFTLARPNILPVNDLGLRRAVMNVYNLRKLPDEKRIFEIAKKNNWSPYSSLASWYLWKSLEI